MAKNVEQSIQTLENALAKLEAAVQRRVQRHAGSDDLQVEIQTLSSDRAKLADRLDQSTAKVEALEAVNRDVSNRLVTAMETVSAVLKAELEEV